jgi:hypothetical protein
MMQGELKEAEWAEPYRLEHYKQSPDETAIANSAPQTQERNVSMPIGSCVRQISESYVDDSGEQSVPHSAHSSNVLEVSAKSRSAAVLSRWLPVFPG